MEDKIIGFVINKTKYKDNDAIVNIYCDNDETIAFKANGVFKANSKNAIGCEYFLLSEYLLNTKKIISLKSSSVLKLYKKPFENINTSMIFFQIINIIKQNKDHLKLYKIAIECFDLLETSANEFSVLSYLLKYIIFNGGYKADYSSCGVCGSKKNIASFDFSLGGFICENCLNSYSMKYKKNLLIELYNLLSNENYYEIKEIYSKEIYLILKEFINQNFNIFIEDKNLEIL